MSAEMLQGDARALPLDDESVDCIVTSPPYNVDLEYSGVRDDLPWEDYCENAAAWAKEMHRVLKPGGRAWVNVVHATNQFQEFGQRTGTRRNLMAVWVNAMDASGLLYREIVVWAKGVGNQETAWGSYLSPNAPNLRGRWEPILVYHKDHWTRARDEGQNDISATEWTEFTRNVWTVTPEGMNRWHPAPFPREIPRRAILLSTWKGDTVLDPFAGSGTTVRVAHELGRHGIGVELSAEYVRRWHERGVQQVLA